MPKFIFNFELNDPYEALGIILSWYYSDKDTLQYLLRGMRLRDKFLRNETSQFKQKDFFIFYDALGSFDQRNHFLEDLYKKATTGFFLKKKKKDFS